MTIRQATNSDIPCLLEIEKSCFKRCDRFMYHHFWYAINKSKGKIFVYQPARQPIMGYIILNTFSHHMRIYSLAVAPDFRKKGVAGKLLQSLVQAKHYHYVSLEVRKDNVSAIRFYEKNGFEKKGVRAHYYGDGMAAILMRKEWIKA